MCRFTLYLGPTIRLSTLLTEPEHSLIRQSTHSRERDEPLNGDGFGVGWYTPEFSEEPAVFRSITPAWNNRNLHNIARVVASSCVLAHVRAATQSSGVNEANCHPFRYGKYLCMHNGDIGNFHQVRRRLLESVCDEAFNNVYGSTDSEHFFAVFIDELLKRKNSTAEAIAAALDAAISRVVSVVEELQVAEPCYLNVAVSDGHSAVISRYSNDTNHAPESLYFFRGNLYETCSDNTSESEPVLVCSERLTDQGGWEMVPPNHLVVLSRNRQPVLVPCGQASQMQAA